ncbi:RlmE family RNA methyltransferase [Algiphilus sp.]|uniref:RlmE family RNA methyltransferase n=3 Tax=Algiphilus sp. TaxID=1872431 RepID=UPI0025BD51A4|nr:RlmE family RNA methyltransferase [Algiphilus sp.]MCK5769453.1 RlmE family RNA methyltransferase [Algiphilus sp.]
MAKRSSSSGRWLDEHESDAFVARARAEGYRSRAAFKLAELDDKDRLLAPGQCVVDLGAAPGGWLQYCARKLAGSRARIVGIDILPIDPIDGAHVITEDFREQAAVEALERVLQEQPVDLVLSDMAPNISGVRNADQAAAMGLLELAEDFAATHLRAGGSFVAKAFQGEGFDAFVGRLRGRFGSVALRKPKASRSRSREIYVVARDWRDE